MRLKGWAPNPMFGVLMSRESLDTGIITGRVPFEHEDGHFISQGERSGTDGSLSPQKLPILLTS